MARSKLRYDIDSHYGGIILTDLESGSNVFFQPGDDANDFENEWDKCFTKTGRLRRIHNDEPVANVLCDTYF